MAKLTELEKQAARPLIYGKRSVIAWRQGAKTQTRRLVNPQPLNPHWYLKQQESDGRWAWWTRLQDGRGCWAANVRQPYAVGDLLWIREALRRFREPPDMGDRGLVVYAADGHFALDGDQECDWRWKRDKLAAMFMPKWACREYGRVLSVQPERLQDISDGDMIAEGTMVGVGFTRPVMVNAYHGTRHNLYFAWWDDLHKKPGTRSEDTPWVWVYGLGKADDRSE